ncbi:MAG: hypothetical protein H6985_02630 [Pseudomonadales bacterium]|nr:hypothetical protein [Halioglobus sp.]MCP5128459.1 hypothetical protein [Pseudomonadales bacterium]
MFFKKLRDFFAPEVDIPDTTPCPDDHSADDLPEADSQDTFILDENMHLYRKVLEAFKQAEQFIKNVELESNGDDLSVPSINELRYCGHHLVKALERGADAEKQGEELKKAFRHCKRASFDAVELGIIRKLEIIRTFEYDYRKSLVTDVWPDYVECAKQLAEVQQFLGNQGVMRGREDYFNSCLDSYQKVAAISAKTDTVRPKLNLQRRNARWKTAVAAGGWVLAGVLFIAELIVEDPLKDKLSAIPQVQAAMQWLSDPESPAGKESDPVDTSTDPAPAPIPPPQANN